MEIDESLRIDRLTAEFARPQTEQDFRLFIRDRWAKDTRFAIYIAAVFYLAFAITDYMAMHGQAQYLIVLSIRLSVCILGLAFAYVADRYADRLVNGILPTLFELVAMAAFITLTFMRPYAIGWHGMSMMIMLYGAYVFIPNRFPAVVLVGVSSSVAFLSAATFTLELGLDEFARLFVLLVVTNVLAAMANYRQSKLMREEYREHVVLKCANARLQSSIDERLRLEKALRQRAEIDDVTGIANRSAFFEHVNKRLAGEEGGNEPLSALLLDIDYFRQINGTYGHVRSDEVLRALVSVCRSKLEKGQMMARLGGEEFVVLLPGVELADARNLAEEILEECQRTPVAMGDVYVHFTVSIAVVLHRGGEPFSATLRRADETMAAAKYRGRNRVEVLA